MAGRGRTRLSPGCALAPGRRAHPGRRTTDRTHRFGPNIARLRAEGFDERAAWGAFMVLARYAMGFALAEQAGRGATANSTETFEMGLSALVDGLELRLSRG